MVIVDTSVLVDFFREKGDGNVKLAVRALFNAYEATLCGPVEMEFLGGARDHERDRIRAWFNILPYARNDQKLWRKAAGHFAMLKARGLTLPWNDVLIASVAIEHRCRVYSSDNHFTAMAEVLPGLYLYRPGYGGMYDPEANR
jgi:predicted nucleic acid-binding protein